MFSLFNLILFAMFLVIESTKSIETDLEYIENKKVSSKLIKDFRTYRERNY